MPKRFVARTTVAVGAFVLASAGTSLPARAEDPLDPCAGVVGHRELGACWSREVERASAEMNRTVEALRKKLPARAAGSLEKAQKLWLKFRDAHVATMYGVDDPRATYGPDYPICVSISRYVMTRNRTKEVSAAARSRPGRHVSAVRESCPERERSVRTMATKTRVSDVAEDLTRLIAETVPALETLGEEGSLRTRGPGTWSRKQVLGHVIDSALNNLQRFVRAQHGDELRFPDYDQPRWVAAGGYQERPWTSLVSLWSELNAQVAHVVARIPAERLATPCRIGESRPLALEFLVRDYVAHLRHHLTQILDPERAAGKTHPPFV